MGLLDIFRTRSKTIPEFIDKKDLTKNIENQVKMTPQTLEQLRGMNVTEIRNLN